MSLPILSHQYFELHSPSVELFHKWKNLASWNEHLIPLYEWNGILFIGKALDADESKPQFSANEYLRDTMNSLQNPHVLVGAHPEDLAQVWNSWQNCGETSSELPDGLDFNLTSTVTNSSASEEDPFGFLQDGVKPSPPPTPIVTASASSTSTPIVTPPPVPVIQIAPEVTSTNSDDVSIESIFDKLNAHIQRSMILLIENHFAVPWKWSDGFRLQTSTKASSINLKDPSPFRVVYRTCKPYHGIIAENKITKDFSNEWIKNNELKSCTACPIFNSGEIVGILLTTNDNDFVTEKELDLTQAAAREIEQAIEEKSKIIKAS